MSQFQPRGPGLGRDPTFSSILMCLTINYIFLWVPFRALQSPRECEQVRPPYKEAEAPCSFPRSSPCIARAPQAGLTLQGWTSVLAEPPVPPPVAALASVGAPLSLLTALPFVHTLELDPGISAGNLSGGASKPRAASISSRSARGSQTTSASSLVTVCFLRY